MSVSAPKRIGGLESAVFVFALSVAAEIILRGIPGFASQDVVVATRLTLFGIAGLALGYWMQRRYALRLPVAALSFAIGVAASFLVRGLRDNQDGFVQTEDLGFLIGVASIYWAVLLLGAALGVWRHGGRPLGKAVM